MVLSQERFWFLVVVARNFTARRVPFHSPMTSMAVPSVQDRARIVFDCQTANDSANMSSTRLLS